MLVKFVSRCGWIDTYKEIYEIKITELNAAEMAELPRIPIGPKQGN